MYLKSLSVKNFRKFKEFSVNFPSDITIVKGPNEKGKSTILLAILAGFFYDPKKSNKDIDALKSWNSEDLYEMSLAIENNGNDIILKKDFKEKEMSLKNKTTGVDISTFKEISDYLFEIGSLRSLSLFESTACVKHDALSLITQGNREISQALQSILTSSSENVSSDKIIKKVSDALTDIQKGLKQASKSPGVLKDIEENLISLESKRVKIVAELNDISKKVDYLSSIQVEFDNLKKEFDALSSQYEINKKYFKIIDELDGLNSQFNKLDLDVEALKKLEKNKEYILFQLDKMSSLDGFDLKEFYNINGNIKDKESKLEYLKKYSENSKEKKLGKSKLKIIFINIALLFFVLGFFGFLNSLAFVSFFVSILFFIISFFLKSKNNSDVILKESDEVVLFKKDLQDLRVRIDDIFKKNKVKNEEELIVKIKEHNEFCKELEKTEGKEEGILRGFSFDNLKNERALILKKIGIAEEKISDEQKTNMPIPQEQRLLEIDIDRDKKKLQYLEKEILQVLAISNQYSLDKEDLIKLEEEIEFLKEKRFNVERKVKIFDSLSISLKEAQSRIISKSKSRIEDYMKKYLSVITDARYDHLIVNDDLSFSVWSEEKKEMIIPENNLSQGTIDQFYLVARFAILDVLNKGRKSIVLLDDPFHSFDATRREKTKQVLNDLTDKFQIILFTHSSDYDEWGEVVSI
ncbi:MAG: AAA family ATPase [Patescibacteria group bacterium]